MKDDEEKVLILAILWIVSEGIDLFPKAVKTIERGGASLYDLTHPSEREHMDDLPGKRWTHEELIDLCTRAGFADPHLAAAIALAESMGYEGIRGDGGDSWGLFQIDMKYHKHHSKEELRNPEINAQVAYEISKGGKDWRPWSTWWKDAKHRVGPGEGPFRKYL